MTKEESSTVARAISVLLLLARNPEGVPITRMSDQLGTQRAPLYRILRALESARFVRRDKNKLYRLSFGLVPLAQGTIRPFEDIAAPILKQLADSTACTAYLIICAGNDLMTALCIPPHAPGTHLTTPIGFVHEGANIATRLAIEAARTPSESDRAELLMTRARGWALSGGLSHGTRSGMAAPVDLTAVGEEGCVLLLTMDQMDPEKLHGPLLRAAKSISREFAAGPSPSPFKRVRP